MGKKTKSEVKAAVTVPDATPAPGPSKVKPPAASGWLRDISRQNLALVVLTYILLVHLTGLYVFTRGFLLSRVSIPTLAPSYTDTAPIAPTHSKAVVLIIDALRTDFISPHHPIPASPNHHGVLTLPAELSARDPSRSLIFNTYSDPPTSTMQRIKGITTGSLPTFIDISSNFASTAIEEDSIISQLTSSGKKVVFMGDDTWSGLFPTSFAHSHPYDSFNVEDLHTVDNGVIEHLFPYLQPANSSKWDVLIGHFLGVDHVGHRVGPEKDTMRTKLSQMDQVLRDVVDVIDEDTLLVVLGDHGMDSKGNHGGDSNLETAAALWMYSKGAPINAGSLDSALVYSWPTYTYPGSTTSIRHANQIDLVPTLSLLLGLPIPFNNLGSVIPECFSDLETLELATRLNAEQIMTYLEEYGDDTILASLKGPWNSALASKQQVMAHQGKQLDPVEAVSAQHHSIEQHREFALAALEKLRSLWAQFSVPLIALGTAILALSATTLLAFYTGVRNNGPNWDVWVRLALDTALLPSAFAGILTGLIGLVVSGPLDAMRFALAGSIVTSELVLTFPLLYRNSLPIPAQWSLPHVIGPIVMFVHAISFASNSFIMWEDHVVLYLFNTIAFIYLLKALTAPTADMRIKIIICSFALMIVSRLISAITVCREEQQPYCRVTFYSGSTPTASGYALVAIILIALHLPRAIGLTLDRSKSLAGPAHLILGTTWRITLVFNALYWALEWVESWDGITVDALPYVTLLRLWIARASFVSILFVLPYNWVTGSLCIKIERDPDQTGDQSAVTVFGFANAYGSTYILYLLLPFAAVHLVSQPMAQVALAGMLLAILAHIEITDTHRDAILMRRSFAMSEPGHFDGTPGTSIVRPGFTDVVPIVLLGFIGFFATGHQAVLTSIQWKAAFVGFSTVVRPFSPALVILNTWGPFALSAFALPLLALWNISPRPQGSIPLIAHTLQVALAGMIYHTVTTLASAIFAAHLRRHLMVWKVFAPRFMLAGVTLLVFDLSLIIAVGFGMRITAWKVWRTFKCVAV